MINVLYWFERGSELEYNGFFILLTPKNLYNKVISIATIVARCQAGIFI